MTSVDDDLEEALREMERRFNVTDDVAVAYRDPRTGELTDADGEPIDSDADLIATFSDVVVMPRERAEAEGRDILGPADLDGTTVAEYVRVPMERREG